MSGVKRTRDGQQTVYSDLLKVQKTTLQSTATSYRTLLLPDKNDTLATLSDITGGGGGGNVYLNANNAFTGTNSFLNNTSFYQASLTSTLKMSFALGPQTTLIANSSSGGTVTLPGSTGTLALLSDITSALSGYAQTGTTQTWTAVQTFTSNPVIAAITNGSATLTLPSTSGTLAKLTDIPSLSGYAQLGTAQSWTAVQTFSSNPVIAAITNGAATLTLPSTTGTLALTSQIPSLSGYAQLGVAQNWTATQTFTSNPFISNIRNGVYALAIPTLSGNDTIATLALANTFTNTCTFNQGISIPTGQSIATPQIALNNPSSGSAAFCTYAGSGLSNIAFPTSSGTLALTSQIPSLTGYAQLGVAQSWTAAQTFSTNPVIAAITNGGFTYTLPTLASNDTFMTNGSSAVVTNKNLVDANTFWVNNADNTKTVQWSVGNATGVALIIATSQTTSQTCSFPNVSSGDTIAVVNLAQTLSNKTLAAPSFSGSFRFVTTNLGAVATPVFTMGAAGNDGLYSSAAGNVTVTRAGVIGANFSSSGMALYNSAGTFAATLTTAAAANFTLTLPNVTSTLAALGLAQTFTTAQTFSGQIINTKAGATTAATAGFYSNPATVAMSGASNYYWNYFAAPPATASTTGTAATVCIAGASAGTASAGNYALQVIAGQNSVPAGTVGAPSIVFGANNSSGLCSSAANIVNTSISGVNVLAVNSTGATVNGKTTTTTLAVGSSGTTFNQFQSNTISYASSLAASFGSTTLAISFNFSSIPTVLACVQSAPGTNQNAVIVTVGSVTTTTANIIITNAYSSPTTGTIVVNWFAFN